MNKKYQSKKQSKNKQDRNYNIQDSNAKSIRSQQITSSNSYISNRANKTNKTNKNIKDYRKRLKKNNIDGLITQRQEEYMRSNTKDGRDQQIISSQYTHATGKTNTKSNMGSIQFQMNYDQFQKDEMKEIFVSKQQQKVIQTILEIARKGKINQKNAFQIPIKLANEAVVIMNSESGGSTQSKFWKFASQLLGTSINIFDKRIQNTWINTNLIHDKLARINLQTNNQNNQHDDDGNQAYQQNQSKPTKQHKVLTTISLQQFRNQNSNKAQSTLTHDTDKISMKKFQKQFDSDPTFFKKLRTFDSTSNHQQLLLNIFNVGSSCQIQLFAINQFDGFNRKYTQQSSPSSQLLNNNNKNRQDNNDNIVKQIRRQNKQLLEYLQNNTLKQIRLQQQQSRLQNKPKKQLEIFDRIRRFQLQNIIKYNNTQQYNNNKQQQQQQIQNTLKDNELEKIFLQQFINYQKQINDNKPPNRIIIDLQNHDFSMVNSQPQFYNDTNNNNNNNQHLLQHQNQLQNLPNNDNIQYIDTYSQSTQYNNINTQQYFMPSSYNSNNNDNNDRQFYSVMTPWQLQFRDGKLSRNTRNKTNKNNMNNKNKRNINKNKQKIQSHQIQFDQLIIQNKDKVLKCENQKKTSKSTITKNIKNNNSNLLPSHMAVYQKYNYMKIKNNSKTTIANDNDDIVKQQYNGDIASFLAPDPSMFQDNNNNNKQQNPNDDNIIIKQNQYDNQQFINNNRYENNSNNNQNLLSSNNKNNNIYTQYNSNNGYNKLINIRQLKRLIYQQVSDQRQIRLSQLQLNTDPSNILITFLHLANQKNLVVKGNQDNSDVILRWD